MNNFKARVRRFGPPVITGVSLIYLLATLGATATAKRTWDWVTNKPRTGAIEISAFDGTRQPMPANTKMLVRIIDGNQKEVFAKFITGANVRVTDLPWNDNFVDRHIVIVSVDGYGQAGFHPVDLKRGEVTKVELMLLPKKREFNFPTWDQLKAANADAFALFSSGTASDAEAKARYEQLMKEKPGALAHLFNVSGALGSIKLESGATILPAFKELIFDDRMKQNNFFGYVDQRLVAELRQEVARGTWGPAAGSQVFHGGNTASFKEHSFWEANVQVTFYENDSKVVNGVTVVLVEVDIDYYRDTAAHVLLEVLPNQFGGKTDPTQCYQLRWIAARHYGAPAFDPFYTIVEKKGK